MIIKLLLTNPVIKLLVCFIFLICSLHWVMSSEKCWYFILKCWFFSWICNSLSFTYLVTTLQTWLVFVFLIADTYWCCSLQCLIVKHCKCCITSILGVLLMLSCSVQLLLLCEIHILTLHIFFLRLIFIYMPWCPFTYMLLLCYSFVLQMLAAGDGNGGGGGSETGLLLQQALKSLDELRLDDAEKQFLRTFRFIHRYIKFTNKWHEIVKG